MAKTTQLINTLLGAVKLGGATGIFFRPLDKDGNPIYENNGSDKVSKVYSLENIIADTTSISQDDPTTNEIACETRDEPIFQQITNGSFKFSAESGDIQEKILTELLGYTKVGGIICAPAAYKEVWAELRVCFGDVLTEDKDNIVGTLGTLVCPLVKMNAKVEAASLKTGMVKGTLGGTLYSKNFKVETDTYVETQDSAIDSEKTYYTEAGGEYTKVTNPQLSDITDYYEREMKEITTPFYVIPPVAA